MPNNTTPDGVVYPVVGDIMSPLNGWFAQLASSVQTALSALRGELAAATAGSAVRIGKAAGSGSDQTGIVTDTEITGTSVPFTLTAVTKINFQAWINTYSGSVSDVIAVRIRNNTTVLAEFTDSANSSPTAGGTSQSHAFSGEVDLPAGSHRLNISILRVAGTGNVTVTKSAVAPPTLIVNRIA